MARVLSPGEPLTRSRTSLFLSYRDSSIRPPSTPATPYPRYYEDDYDLDDEEAGLLVPGGSNGEQVRRGSAMGLAATRRASGAVPTRRVSVGGQLPPKWVDVADKVDEVILQVKPKSASSDEDCFLLSLLFPSSERAKEGWLTSSCWTRSRSA